MLSIVEDRRKYEFVTSQQYKTTINLTIKYDNTKESVFFVPIENKSIDIDVYDSRGKRMTQLPEKELKRKFDISASDMTDEHITHNEKFSRIPVLLLPSDSEFETVTITYISPLDPKRYSTKDKSLNMNMIFGFRISPGEFSINSPKYEIEKIPYDLHVTIETGKDYKLKDDYEAGVKPAKSSVITKQSKKTTNLVTFRVFNLDFDSEAHGKITIGVAESTANAATVILITGIAIPIFLIAIQILTNRLFYTTPEILGGVIAVLIGSRIWIIQDKYIMKRWIGLYRVTFGFNAAIFVFWFILWTQIIQSFEITNMMT